MTILESVEKWEQMPLARVLFDLANMGFSSKMEVYPANCESGVMASVRLEKDGSFSGNVIGSTPSIVKERIVKWADGQGIRDFLKEGGNETEKI